MTAKEVLLTLTSAEKQANWRAMNEKVLMAYELLTKIDRKTMRAIIKKTEKDLANEKK